MKKILFLQNIGNSYGGVWFVNKSIASELVKCGYDVEILSIRDSHDDVTLDHDKNLKVSIVNKKDSWEITHFEDIKKEIKKIKILKAIKLIFKKINEEFKLRKDYNYVKKYIKDSNFDYIVTSHYQVLDCVPKDFLKRTIHEQHTNFETSYSHRATKKTFDKYNGKIKFLWLSKKSCELAKEKGYKNSYYIYNPLKFNSKNRADVLKNKKLITITRMSTEKRIDLMINIVNDVLKDNEFCDWTLEIYGDGNIKKDIENLHYDKTKIKLMGITNNPKDVLMSSAINLNTSLFEGFSMGILEAMECGIPTISFRFGESVDEEIINNKTGIIVEKNNIDEYKKKLVSLMKNKDLLDKMSINCKEFAKNFEINIIIQEWIKLFNSL